MKAFFTILSFLLLSAIPSWSQSKKVLASELSRDLAAYKNYSLRPDFDSMFQYMPAALFDIVPRDSMLELMEKSFDNEYFSISLDKFDYTVKPKIRKAGKYAWCLAPYTGQMTFHFKTEPETYNLMVVAMKSQFGKENVEEASNNALIIYLKNKQLIAFKDPGLSVWSMIEDKRESSGREAAMQKMIFETVVPEEVQKALKKHKK